MRWALALELAYLVGGVATTVALFAAAAWAYPQGADTIWPVGGATVLAVMLMCVLPIRRAWRGRRAR